VPNARRQLGAQVYLTSAPSSVILVRAIIGYDGRRHVSSLWYELIRAMEDFAELLDSSVRLVIPL